MNLDTYFLGSNLINLYTLWDKKKEKKKTVYFYFYFLIYHIFIHYGNLYKELKFYAETLCKFFIRKNMFIPGWPKVGTIIGWYVSAPIPTLTRALS